MKHIILVIGCLITSTVVAFYDRFPLSDGGLFILMKHAPWLFDFPIWVGTMFTPKTAHGVSPWGFGFGFFIQSVALIYGVWFLVLLVINRFIRTDLPS